MKLSRRIVVLSFPSLFVIFTATAYLCGTERWNVKVCKDPQVKVLFENNSVASHQLKPFVPTIISHLVGMQVPGQLALHTPRFVNSEAETTIYELNATLIEYKEERGHNGDNDYHLVIRDSSGNSMVAEIPKENCLANTPEPLRSMIRQARADFNSKFTVTGSFQNTNTKVKITGQGFFDRPHASATATNGIEIHPVMKIEFLN